VNSLDFGCGQIDLPLDFCLTTGLQALNFTMLIINELAQSVIARAFLAFFQGTILNCLLR
jgi:hypothetical protein